jgi:hypothetical protein
VGVPDGDPEDGDPEDGDPEDGDPEDEGLAGVDREAPASSGSPEFSDPPDIEHEADSTAAATTIGTAASPVMCASWQLP